MLDLLDYELYFDDLKSACLQLNELPKTEERRAVSDHVIKLLAQKKRHEALNHLRQFLGGVQAQKEAALKEALKEAALKKTEPPSTPPRKREFRIEDCPPKPT